MSNDLTEKLGALREKIQGETLKKAVKEIREPDLEDLIDDAIDAALRQVVKEGLISKEKSEEVARIAKKTYRKKSKI